ncbi:MAG: glutaredoxin family protein [Pseudomonadota bacterium]|nr:glutaredoxin family protein [Pseudomonadota bacterium]
MTTRAAAVVVGVALMAASGMTLAQQMYKWKDDQGVVHYSDTPPPPHEKRVEMKDFSSATAPMTPAVPLPYALAQAVKNNPVTLYTSSDCVPCDQARAALRDRGVPFSEKTVSNDADRAKLADAGGGSAVPFITVGSKKLVGYGADELQGALTAATYPLTKRLPPGYQNPPIRSAAPAGIPVAAAKKLPVPDDDQPVLQESPPPSPTGIRF